jgi:aspartyl-tRNA(Asn)/glutamyl-tRNA(Gln) amidotransferase subunit C
MIDCEPHSRIAAAFLDSAALNKLCDLARLAVGPEELPDVSDKLTRIVAFVDQLQAVDTDTVSPMAHPLDQPQRLRVDRVTETNERDRFQANACSVERGLYLVPKVIE